MNVGVETRNIPGFWLEQSGGGRSIAGMENTGCGPSLEREMSSSLGKFETLVGDARGEGRWGVRIWGMGVMSDGLGLGAQGERRGGQGTDKCEAQAKDTEKQ